MKITQISAYAVRIPLARKGTFTRAERTHADRTIVVLETDTGLRGVGETRGTGAADIINTRFAPALAGQPVADRRALRRLCIPDAFDHGYPEQLVDANAYTAIDLAVWDVTGKAAKMPLHALLGGKVRERAPFVAYDYVVDADKATSPAATARAMADQAEAAIARSGASVFEFKVGVYPLAHDIAAAHAVRDRLGPDVGIAIDANMGWSADEARTFLTATRDVGFENVEEPVADLTEMNRLARAFGVPVSSHCFNLDALKPHDAVTGCVADLHSLGGLEAWRNHAIRAHALGKRPWFRSVWELGISWAAMCHFMVAVPEVQRPAQALFNWIDEDLVLGDKWDVRDGGVAPPDAPGLGVELDEAALEKFTV
ncbi:mandelate racemase/muconate lactonizing enzyme family protein [Roseovarius spongiae]|uniref:mandelate racemase/muconate lactonizing enzyme family protein n=1 Tax=Roseovarius spongiae TaxID=2320272 RepID=UPI00140AAFCA|nr:mandelate racemase/muconate lactonizing enzyme family protein [Roseovarius spongiae]